MARLTFAGVKLGFPDADGTIQEWIDRYRPLDDVFAVAQPASRVDGRSREQGHWPHAVGLPTFNWQQLPPRWRINSLWWPTGASRFAIGLFLTNLTGANQIKQEIGSDGSGMLVMAEGVGDNEHKLELPMFCLPPRPLGAVGESTDPLVLIPLVDRRYFWQWSQCGQMFFSPTSTWENVTAVIVEGLGAEVTLPAPEGYDGPDWSGFNLDRENAALVLDGYAASVGQRFVATLDGSYQCQRADVAAPLAQDNLDAATIVAGGEFVAVQAAVPGSVSVVFPRRQGGIVEMSGACHVINKSAADFGGSGNEPGRATIHTTFQADYSLRSENPSNGAAMDTLATAIARDFYGWRQKQYSGSIAGLASNWVVTGFDDYLWFLFGTPAPKPCEDDDGCDMTRSPWLATTLVQSMPHNLGVEENLAQHRATPGTPRTFRPMPITRAVLVSEFADSGGIYAAVARLLYGNTLGELSPDSADVAVFDTMGLKGSATIGNTVWVTALGADTSMFELVGSVGGGASVVKFSVPTNRDPSSENFMVDVEEVLSGEPPGETIEVWDEAFLYRRAPQGAVGFACFNGEAERWEVLVCQQQCLLARALVNDTGGMGEAGYVTIDNFEACTFGIYSLPPNPLPTQAINFFLHKGRNDDDLMLAWDEASTDWIIIDVTKHEINVVLDLRLNDDKTQIQTNHIAIAAEVRTALADATWTNKIAVSKKSVLRDVRLKADKSQIEAQAAEVVLIAPEADAWADKIALATKSVLLDMREKGDGTALEAQAVDALMIANGAEPTWADKVEIQECEDPFA